VKTRNANSIAHVIRSGLCIGCGLCEAVSHGQVKMQMTSAESLRPEPANGFSDKQEKLLLAICPGIHVTPRQQTHDLDHEPSPTVFDDIWGKYTTMRYAWSANNAVRFKGSTGGVLTSLASYLLSIKRVAFILHVKANPDKPVQSLATISETAADVLNGTGSRYGPVAPLTGLLTALDRNEPFAVIAKPCDLSGIHNYASHDERVNALITHRLTMVCGGQSTAQKAKDLLHQASIKEQDVTLYRHRGYGNPGPTRIESHSAEPFEISYQELWSDESNWGIEPRCKLCPDALGEAADISAADVWPGGSPEGDDEGFNGVVVRTKAGEELISDAVQAGELIVGDDITPEQFNAFQPHQVRKKIALDARYQGLADAGLPTINAPLSRLSQLGKRLKPEARTQERDGTAKRFSR